MNMQSVNTLEKPESVTVLGIQTGFTTQDFAVGVGAPFVALVLGVFLGIPAHFIIPIVVTVGTISMILVFAAPTYLDIMEFVSTIRYYLRNNGTVDNVVTETVADDPDDALVRNFKTASTTREMTGVHRFYPNANVLERDDGHYVGALRVSPPNRDFDTREDFVSVAKTIKERLNKNIDFGFQFYITTRPFPIEVYVEELEARLEDEDIQSKPIMEAVLEEKIEKRPDALEQKGTELPHYYLIVSAAPRDVDINTTGTESPVKRLMDIPVLGLFFEIFSNIQSDVEQHQREAKLIERVQNRLSRLDQAIVRPNDEFSSEVVSTTEWTELLHTYWTGREQVAPNSREQPASAGVADIPQVSEQVSANDDHESTEGKQDQSDAIAEDEVGASEGAEAVDDGTAGAEVNDA